MTEPPDGGQPLKRVIGTAQLWAIAVGMVISGQYFGWNYGWAASGTVGFLISVLIVSVLYITFVFSYTELTTSIPDAGGPFEYAYRAFGKTGGFIAGFATCVDFLLAPPAIAIALGSYANFLIPSIPAIPIALGAYCLFIAINLLSIKETANFSLFITILSVVEIIVFLCLIYPHYETAKFLENSPVSASGIFAGLPYAVWFFVAIEGVAMVAEEVKNPAKTIPKGYISAIITLVVLSMGIMILSGGVGDWRLLTNIDHPLPETLSMALGKENPWSKIFTSLGLFGLIASFHANTIGYSRQLYALARKGYLPKSLAEINKKFNTPHWALLVGGLIGLLAIFSGKTDKIILMSVLGALVMYMISMASLMTLRKKYPEMHRPYKTPFYPIFPIIAFILSGVCMAAIIYFNFLLSLAFFGLLLLGIITFLAIGINYVQVPQKLANQVQHAK